MWCTMPSMGSISTPHFGHCKAIFSSGMIYPVKDNCSLCASLSPGLVVTSSPSYHLQPLGSPTAPVALSRVQQCAGHKRPAYTGLLVSPSRHAIDWWCIPTADLGIYLNPFASGGPGRLDIPGASQLPHGGPGRDRTCVLFCSSDLAHKIVSLNQVTS